ncbi:MAG: DUF615 domain-containing protein [Casimicrobiaceae bacterium]|nr:DUF615 domain-containing protein [Casimicrobiaceae bacterium]
MSISDWQNLTALTPPPLIAMTLRAKHYTRLELAAASDRGNPPSKSARKRHMHALQNLGARLASRTPEQWRALELPESLIDALTELSRLKSFEARRRQLQYVGKLMRSIDPAPIEAQLARWEAQPRAEQAAVRNAELWRARLLEDHAALEVLLSQYPELDRARLKTLVIEARQRAGTNAGTTAARALFRLLHQSFSQAS